MLAGYLYISLRTLIQSEGISEPIGSYLYILSQSLFWNTLFPYNMYTTLQKFWRYNKVKDVQNSKAQKMPKFTFNAPGLTPLMVAEEYQWNKLPAMNLVVSSEFLKSVWVSVTLSALLALLALLKQMMKTSTCWLLDRRLNNKGIPYPSHEMHLNSLL